MGGPSRVQAFEDEALVHLDQVYSLALRLTRSRTEAEDLVQETYLRAFRHFDRYNPGTNCRAWLFAILRNAFVNRLRRRGREVPGLDEAELERLDAGMSEIGETIDSPETILLRRVTIEGLAAALDDLPLAFREVVVLADVEECSYREIADICGIPLGTVMSRLSRGRRLLRRYLEAGARPEREARRVR